MTTVVITNDDGIDSPGLAALAAAAVAAGYDVVVAAPLGESSGTSAGLTAAAQDRRVITKEHTLPSLPDVPAYAVDAHPGLISLAACHGAFGPVPDMLLSGINRGANVGRAVLHSGTVGAALTASINGVRSLAVSIDVALEPTDEPHWTTAAGVVAGLLPVLVDGLPDAVLNINVPDTPPARLKEAKWAPLAPFGSVRARVERAEDGAIQVGSVVGDEAPEPGSDAALLAEGHVTVTALRSVAEDGRMQGTLTA
ncbi:5'/3'-nucleotidase SurE [Actinokineospora soli]|uniref:5'-nucleotidase n=1 Tax=Actinokineospora soli TaxID=1048753 RepID=A0ABW2TT09_9PSEU